MSVKREPRFAVKTFQGRDDLPFNTYLDILLDSLKKVALKPEQYSFSDDPKSEFRSRKFDAEEIRLEFPRQRFDDWFALKGKKAFKFEFDLSSRLKPEEVSLLMVKGLTQQDWERYTQGWTDLIRETRPLFGGVLPVWSADGDEAAAWNSALNSRGFEFRRFGPPSLAMRTWLRADLAAFVDLGAMRQSGADVTELAGYGIQLDLFEQPWTHTFEALSRQMNRLNAIFEQSGVRGDYSDFLERRAGPRWAEVNPNALKRSQASDKN